MNARILALFASLLWPVAANAQGFAGLGESSDGYAAVKPETVLTFPKDHKAHPDFRIEWWYVTANLTDKDGKSYGVQWTLFRQASAPPPQKDGWQSQQMWLGHAALTSQERHLSAETIARGLTGQAGVELSPFTAWIDDWKLSAIKGDGYQSMTMAARGDNFAYALKLQAKGPLVLHGQDGYSRKSEQGQASHYYSQPFYEVTGEVEFDGRPILVTGQAWLDREWSSQPLASNQTGWDWFSLHLDSGDKLMLFQLREKSGEAYYSGTWINRDGSAEPLGPTGIKLTPLKSSKVAGRSLPTKWQVGVPGKNIDITVAAINEQSWMETSIPYWEGSVTVSGSHNGIGFLEMTGYEQE